MDTLNTYRLNSMEEPTDEQLAALMEQVGEDARESTLRASEELGRRMAELKATIQERRSASR